MKPKKIRVGLISPCGWGNLGDAAIQESMLNGINRWLPDADVIMLTSNPLDTEVRHGVKSFPLTSTVLRLDAICQNFNPIFNRVRYTIRVKEILKQIPCIGPLLQPIKNTVKEMLFLLRVSKIVKTFDCLIVSGGGQLDDYWGGPWGHPFTLMKWAVAAKLHRIPVLFVSVGAGPLDFSLSRYFVKIALYCGLYRSFRDRKSQEMINDIGFGGRTLVRPDLAFGLVSSQPSKSERNSDKPLVVGLTPFAYCDPRVWPEKDHSRYAAYLNKLSEIVAWLYQCGFQVSFFPTQYQHDIPVIKDLLELLSRQGVHCPVAPQTYEISMLDQLLSRIQETDLVIASRLHGVILSQYMLKPVVAISYHSKVVTLMRDLDLTDYCVNIDRFDIDSLKKILENLILNKTAITNKLGKKILDYQIQLEEQFSHIFSLI